MNAPSHRLPSLRLHSSDAASSAGKLDLPGLNTVRAVAALGVVMLHAGVPYLQHPMPGLQWSVRDTTSAPVDYLFWAIEIFIMPVFLLLAGFLAWQTLARKGHIPLLRSRAKRLLVPLLFGMLVVLPIDLYIWVAGWISDGLVSPVKLKSLKFDGSIGQNIWGLSHLWFLLYLFLYVAVTAFIVQLTHKSKRLFWFTNRLASSGYGLTAMVLFAVGALTLTFRPEVVWGFQHAFAPVPSKWIYSGTFFAGGMLLAVADPAMNQLKQHTARIVPLAVLFLAAAVVLGRWQLGTEMRAAAGDVIDSPQSAENLLAAVTLALVTTMSAWLVSLSLVGIAVLTVRRNSLLMQYLAAASFWVYLVHHPLLGLTHIDLKWLLPGTSPLLKMGLAFSVSTAVSLATYEAFIRKTSLGRMLGFAWAGPSQPAVKPPLDQTIADDQQMAA
ncbi:acyltransferase family protein [Planctomycetes bacterium K23_9]|uniref:Glucans biosynthesis protein n=1 Tax=Stieleria marina TaxID=1930275 RepID=A0A517NYP2_9BACT|nr:glucans biosynthesis protein [Planctomycetes bacterium K23_9]